MRSKIAVRAGSAPQVAFVQSSEPFPAFVGGFGSGKTAAGIMRALRLKFLEPEKNIAYYLPTYDLVRRIGYPRVTEILDDLKIKYRLNKSEHVISIKNRGAIIFRTLDNPDRIVGYEVADSIIDELDTLKPADAERCWNQIIARNRQKKSSGLANSVGVATTPEGFRFVYERWHKAPTEGYQLIRASTYSNERNLPAGYIESLKRSYPAQLINAYINGEFVNLQSGVVYPDFDRRLNATNAVLEEGEELHIGQDFNVYNCSSVVGVERNGRPMVIGELTKMRDTPHVIETIKQKYPGRRIHIYPDASGQSNKTINATESDLTLLKNAGFVLHVDSRNPYIKDRVMSVNGVLCNSENERRLLVNTEFAPHLTECLEQQIYDDNGQPDKTAGKDHLPDALGYWIYQRWPINKPVSTRSTQFSFVNR